MLNWGEQGIFYGSHAIVREKQAHGFQTKGKAVHILQWCEGVEWGSCVGKKTEAVDQIPG